MTNSIIAQLKSISEPVLVTGHTGFKGTWLTLLLDNLGISWVGISLQPELDSLYKLVNRSYSNEYFLDIRNFHQLEQILTSVKPAHVIHLAAEPLVLNSYKNPRQTFETNIMGTVNLLDILFKMPSTRKIIVATTDKVYKQNKYKRTFKESSSLGGKDPYSWSKVGAESAIGAWQNISKITSGPVVTAVRAGNVIGGGDLSKNRLLPDLIKGLSSQSDIIVRNPNSTRPWQHVLDPLVGYLMLLASSTILESVNFSTNEKSMTVKKVAELSVTLWGGKAKLVYQSDSQGIESKNLSLNSDLARNKLGWQSLWSQKESISETINWWKEVKVNNVSPYDACNNNITFALNKLTVC